MSNDEKNGDSFKVVDKRKFSEETAADAGDIKDESKPEDGKDRDAKNNSDANTGGGNSEINAGSESGVPFEADFATFIYSLNTQALLFMGKISNPMTGKYEKDIDTAKYLIDTIDMLSKKTKGNLDQNETKLIENILYDLRMAYISEKK